MTPLSPSPSASSSTTIAQSSSSQLPKDMLDFEMDSGLDFFNFDSFESDHEASTAHSPNTISPNHTPSPQTTSQSPVTIVNPLLDPMDDFDFDFGFNKMPMSMSGPSEPIPIIKQEPLEFGWTQDSGSSSPVVPAAIPAVPAVPQPRPQPASAPDVTLGPITPEQQLALQQLMFNILNYQKGLGMHTESAPTVAPTTIQPSLVFSTSPNQASTSISSSTISPSALSQAPQAQAEASSSKPRAASSSSAHSAQLDISRDFEREASPPLREVRQGSTFSSLPDLDSKIDGLVPLNDIFSAGRGKGGKKGGGVSSVVRMEDEDLDEDDSWRPSAEEYKKLSSKEKRQLRNKLSARAFRTRRKDYIGTLEEHIKHRDSVIDAIRSELASSKSENMDLRRELEALKANTMNVLHPETAEVESQAPAFVSALSMSSAAAPAPIAGPSQPARRSATPVFNTRKDLSSSIGSSAFWAGNDKNMFGGGSTICHHLLTPDLVLPDSNEASSSTSVPTLKSLADLPRVNLNPALNDTDVRGNNLRSSGNARDMSSTFDNWADNNAFSLRSMDSYRMQLWSRLAREAAADKAEVPPQLRPKFLVEPKTQPSAATNDFSPKGITDRLASSFWSAFEGPSAKLDAAKLAAVVTGAAKLKVVAASSSSPLASIDEYNEKAAPAPVSAARAAADAINSTDALSMAMGSLKLVAGNGGRLETFSVRENPLGALSSFFMHAATPARA